MNGVDLHNQRRLLDATQAEMAARMGVSLRSYHRYESSIVDLPDKIANLVSNAVSHAASMKPKLDGRFKKPMDWAALGKKLFVYQNGVEVAYEYRKGGDPSGRVRFKTMADAVADPSLSARQLDHARNYETDDEIHVYIV